MRSASSTAAAMAGLSTEEIMQAANWSSQSVFEKFYFKPTDKPKFGKTVLSTSQPTAVAAGDQESVSATNNTVVIETEPSEI